jgi:hypothetical protein
MYIKKFNQYMAINELYVHKNDEDLNDKFFILFKKDLWIFSEEEWEENELYDIINKAFGEEIVNSDLYSSLQNIRETNFHILTGQISDYVIYLDLSNSDYRHSEHSDDLYKLKKELNMPVKIKFYTGKYLDKE